MKEIKNEKIFDLLAEKTFVQLNTEEQKLVLEEMNQEDYEAFRLVVGDFKIADDNLDFEIPKFQFSSSTGSTGWWHRSIPRYQTAAIVVIAVSLTFLLTKTGIQIKKSAVAETSQIDTLVSQQGSVTLEDEDYPEAFVISM